ncbi:MAG: hypothetical protein JWP14_642 [Frankiales bacterium]|jgi:hypothetical protein|nr:hypothetical protein [Frankiales bacterium]
MTSPGGDPPVQLEDEPVVFVHAALGAPGSAVRTSPGSTASVALEDEPYTWFEVPNDARASRLSAPPRSTAPDGGHAGRLAATGWSPSLLSLLALGAGALRLRARRMAGGER